MVATFRIPAPGRGELPASGGYAVLVEPKCVNARISCSGAAARSAVGAEMRCQAGGKEGCQAVFRFRQIARPNRATYRDR
jgi:hypothetical protein